MEPVAETNLVTVLDTLTEFTRGNPFSLGLFVVAVVLAVALKKRSS